MSELTDYVASLPDRTVQLELTGAQAGMLLAAIQVVRNQGHLPELESVRRKLVADVLGISDE